MTVRFKSATVDEFIEQHCHDISRSGMFVKTNSPFPTSTLVKFEIRIGSDATVIQGVGRVVWKRDSQAIATERPAGMGVKFIKLDEGSRQVIDRLVEAHGGTREFDPPASSSLRPGSPTLQPGPETPGATGTSRHGTMIGLGSIAPPSTSVPPSSAAGTRQTAALLAETLLGASGQLQDVGSAPLVDVGGRVESSSQPKYIPEPLSGTASPDSSDEPEGDDEGDEEEGDDEDEAAAEPAAPAPPPPARSRAGVVVRLVVYALLLVGAGVAVWFFLVRTPPPAAVRRFPPPPPPTAVQAPPPIPTLGATATATAAPTTTAPATASAPAESATAPAASATAPSAPAAPAPAKPTPAPNAANPQTAPAPNAANPQPAPRPVVAPAPRPVVDTPPKPKPKPAAKPAGGDDNPY